MLMRRVVAVVVFLVPATVSCATSGRRALDAGAMNEPSSASTVPSAAFDDFEPSASEATGEFETGPAFASLVVASQSRSADPLGVRTRTRYFAFEAGGPPEVIVTTRVHARDANLGDSNEDFVRATRQSMARIGASTREATVNALPAVVFRWVGGTPVVRARADRWSYVTWREGRVVVQVNAWDVTTGELIRYAEDLTAS
jgi:hypothetical protein